MENEYQHFNIQKYSEYYYYVTWVIVYMWLLPMEDDNN